MAKAMTTKAASSGKSAAVIKEYNERLGPVRRVISMTRAKGMEASYRLQLECKHVRIATKRSTLRCGQVRRGAREIQGAQLPPRQR